MIARTISVQSLRRYASPPMSEISRVPSRASDSTTSKHSSVLSSETRLWPARDPQCRHLRSQARVISQDDMHWHEVLEIRLG